jgi:hypothetical protein
VYVRDFLQRRRQGGFGRFLTAADIVRWNPADATMAVTTVPGLFVGSGRTGNVVMGRGPFGGGSCPAVVILDGVPLEAGERLDQLVRPSEIAGIEVYVDPTFAPPEYYSGRRMPNCSAVLIWTR